MRSKRQRLGQPRGLGHRLGVVGEARGHRRRRGEHVAVVAAPQRLGGVERRVLADRDEDVLQPRPRARVRVDVAGRHARHARAARPARPARGCSARSWRANGRCSSTRKPSRPKASSSRRIVGSSRTPCVAQPLRQTSPSACASTSSSETLGFSATAASRDRAPAPRRRASVHARVRVRAREQPAEVAPAARVAHQQREVPRRRPARRD